MGACTASDQLSTKLSSQPLIVDHGRYLLKNTKTGKFYSNTPPPICILPSSGNLDQILELEIVCFSLTAFDGFFICEFG